MTFLGQPLSSNSFLIRSISPLSLRLVQIIWLILRLRGLKDSQRKSWPVKVRFRYTLVSKLVFHQLVYQWHWWAVREFLTFFDTIRFCRYLTLLDGRTESKSKIKNERLLFSLRRDRFGNALSDTTRHILNLSDYDLSDTESFLLSHGLNLGCRPGICAKKKSSPNLNHCGHSFYITMPVLLNNTLL